MIGTLLARDSAGEQTMAQQKKKQKQPNAGKSSSTEQSGNDMPTPSFDEGEPRPSPIESTTNDGLRTPISTTPAGKPGKNREAKGTHTEATMPPGEGRDPKRNTM
jgi:hypothetical protein